MKAKRNYIILTFLTLIVLVSCSSNTESTKPFDPKTHISESLYQDLSLSRLYKYVVSVGKLESPTPGRFELEKTESGLISKLLLEVVDSKTGQSHSASYDSESGIFKIKIDKYTPPEDERFDESLIDSAEALLRGLSKNKPQSVYFLTHLSAKSSDVSFPENSSFFFLSDGAFQEIKEIESLNSEELHFFAVHSLDSGDEYPSYFIVDPKKI